MDKELSEEELYALARGVIGERCTQLEGAFRTDPGGLLAYSEDPFGAALQREAGNDAPTLVGREHAGMLALASLEWLFMVCGRPWLAPDSTIPAETMVERCIRHVRGLLRYLNPSDAEAAYRFAERLNALLHQSERDTLARHIAQDVARRTELMMEAERAIGALHGRDQRDAPAEAEASGRETDQKQGNERGSTKPQQTSMSGSDPNKPAHGAAAAGPEVQSKETKEQRQDRRLQACIDAGLPMEAKSALLRLPDGVAAVADLEGVTRQSFSADVKAALQRRANAAREGGTLHRVK